MAETKTKPTGASVAREANPEADYLVARIEPAIAAANSGTRPQIDQGRR